MKYWRNILRVAAASTLLFLLATVAFAWNHAPVYTTVAVAATLMSSIVAMAAAFNRGREVY